MRLRKVLHLVVDTQSSLVKDRHIQVFELIAHDIFFGVHSRREEGVISISTLRNPIIVFISNYY